MQNAYGILKYVLKMPFFDVILLEDIGVLLWPVQNLSLKSGEF